MNIDEQAAADAIQLKQEREAIRTGLKREFPEANQNLDDIVEALGIFIDHHKEREQQLLSALAAIEKKDEALSLCTGISSIPLDYGFNVGPEFDPARKKASEARNIKADLSALREHDAEARKPLVDALKKMPEVAYQTIIEHAGVELENLPNELQCICDDALAKVK